MTIIQNNNNTNIIKNPNLPKRLDDTRYDRENKHM